MNSMHICSNGGLFNVPIITFIICPFLCFFVLFFRCFFRIFVFVSCVSFVINYLSMLYSFVIHKSCEKSIEGTFLHAKHAINRWQILVIVMAYAFIYAFCCCWVDPWRPVACAFVENLSKCGWSEMFTAGWSINCLSHSIWNDSNTRKCEKKIHDSMRVFSWENNVQATLLPSVPLEKNTEINKILFVPGKNSFMTSVKVHRVNLLFSKDRTNNNQKMYEIVKIFVFIWLPYLEKERRSETLGWNYKIVSSLGLA